MDPGALHGSDVVVVTMDTTRRDRVGCYGETGDTNTPHLDALCRRGVRLDRAIAVAPVTLPAHASMMTGMYPPTHGARYNVERQLAAEPQTLAEALSQHGYQTAAFVSAYVLDPRTGIGRGFDHFDAELGELASGFSGAVNERSAESATDAALAHLRNRDPDRPLLLWVHYFDPHAPYLAHALEPDATDAERYDAEIREMDRQIGRLLTAPGLDPDSSLIMVLADHGEGLGDHGERSHGLFVYDTTIHIPWMIAAPGLAAGNSNALVSQVDLFPTVLDLLDVPLTASIDGRSLLDPPRDADQSVFTETTLPYFDFRLSPLHALRSTRGKYIEAPRPEFYAYATDPAERNNLIAAGVYPDEAVTLAERLDEMLAAWPGVDDVGAAATADAEATERLRSLGYLAGTDMGMELADPKDAAPLIDLHQQAADAASAGRFEQALDLLGDALEGFPGARGSLYLRSRILATIGRHQEAEQDITEVNRQRPNADSLLHQAQLRVLADDLDDARLLLAEARRMDPTHGGAIIVEGDIALVGGDIEAARAAYANALAVDAQRVGRQARTRLSRLPPG